MRGKRPCSALLVLLWCLAACGPAEPPVATLEIEPDIVRLDFSEARAIRLAWEIRRPLGTTTDDLNVFVHLLDEPGEVLRTFDHPFPGEWSVGGRVEYDVKLYQSALGPPLGPGTYLLSVGLYDAGERWPIEVDGDEIDNEEYAVAEVQVGNDTSAPLVRFSESWLPIEAGFDRQVLGYRWLTDHGSIALSEIGASGTLWLALAIPAVEPGARRLVVDPSLEATRVLVINHCGGSEIELTGGGRHEIEIPVSPPDRQGAGTEPGDDACEIVFEPNSQVVMPGTPDRRAVLLETLAWYPVEQPGD